jgi:hypothetical protein
MNVEDTLREAFKLADGWHKKQAGYKPRNPGFETTKTGHRKWTGPRAYFMNIKLPPWQYVDVLHEMNASGFDRGLNMFLCHLIDKHVPRRAARPLHAGIPAGVKGEERRKMIAANLREASRLGHALDPKPAPRAPKRTNVFDATPGAAIPVGPLRTKRGPARRSEDLGAEVATSAAAARNRFGLRAPGRLRQANR